MSRHCQGEGCTSQDPALLSPGVTSLFRRGNVERRLCLGCWEKGWVGRGLWIADEDLTLSLSGIGVGVKEERKENPPLRQPGLYFSLTPSRWMKSR